MTMVMYVKTPAPFKLGMERNDASVEAESHGSEDPTNLLKMTNKFVLKIYSLIVC